MDSTNRVRILMVSDPRQCFMFPVFQQTSSIFGVSQFQLTFLGTLSP